MTAIDYELEGKFLDRMAELIDQDRGISALSELRAWVALGSTTAKATLDLVLKKLGNRNRGN